MYTLEKAYFASRSSVDWPVPVHAQINMKFPVVP